MTIDKNLIEELLAKAAENPRLRQNLDLRTTPADNSQRMLNALMPGTAVPVHRHEDTSETVVCLSGEMDEVIYEEIVSYDKNLSRGMDGQDVMRKVEYREKERIHLCPGNGEYGCQIPKGTWHSVEVFEPSVIFEAKDGAYVPAK